MTPTTAKSPITKPFVKKADEPKAAKPTPALRLLDKHEVLAITGTSYVTLWTWMTADPPKFPRSRIVGGKSKWLSTEVEAWLSNLPVRPLKGDKAPLERYADVPRRQAISEINTAA